MRPATEGAPADAPLAEFVCGVELIVPDIRRLAALGCDLVQGFWLSPPLPPCELQSWLAIRHERRDAA